MAWDTHLFSFFYCSALAFNSLYSHLEVDLRKHCKVHRMAFQSVKNLFNYTLISKECTAVPFVSIPDVMKLMFFDPSPVIVKQNLMLDCSHTKWQEIKPMFPDRLVRPYWWCLVAIAILFSMRGTAGSHIWFMCLADEPVVQSYYLNATKSESCLDEVIPDWCASLELAPWPKATRVENEVNAEVT